jgi:hypothetical protein
VDGREHFDCANQMEFVLAPLRGGPDSNQTASGKPGAVQSAHPRHNIAPACKDPNVVDNSFALTILSHHRAGASRGTHRSLGLLSQTANTVLELSRPRSLSGPQR